MPIVEDLIVLWTCAVVLFILWDIWSRRRR